MNFLDAPLSALAELRITAKTEEDRAIAYRRDIDQAIAIRMKDRDEGTVSVAENGFKITVNYKLNRAIDTAKLQDRWEFISENVRNTFKWKAELVVKHFRALQELNSTDLTEALIFITTKPSSPSVEVEPITNQE